MDEKNSENSLIQRARAFERAIWSCEDVTVTKKAPNGGTDSLTFNGHEARLVMPIRQKAADPKGLFLVKGNYDEARAYHITARSPEDAADRFVSFSHQSAGWKELA